MALTRVDSYSPTVSLASSYPSTECDTNSGSSSSTIPGPGALTGKALKALGEVTLRGLDRIVMARHLAVVAHNFPHTDEQASQIRHVDDMYDDLLEFSRPDMYSRETFEMALRFILSQIGMGQTRYLIKALARWHSVELHLLLSEILIQLAPLWNPSLRLVFSSPLFHSYSVTQAWHRLSPTPLILFLSKLIRTSHRTSKVVLNVGFLDVLMSLCHNYDFNSAHIPTSGHDYPALHRHLLVACNAALLDITAYPEFRPHVSSHPISSLWPKHRPPAEVLPFTTREKALLLNTDRDVEFDDHSPYIALSLDDICALPCVSKIPADQLLESLTFEVIHEQAFRVFLSRSSHAKKVAILSDLVQNMSKLITSTEDTLQSRGDFPWRYQLLFSLVFVTEIARTDSSHRSALVDAGVLTFLVHVLRTEIPDSYLGVIASRSDPSYISAVIREHGLSRLLNERIALSSRMLRSIHAAFAVLFGDGAKDV